MATVLSTLHALGWSRQHETNVTALFLPGAAQFEQPEEPVKAALEAALEFYQVSSMRDDLHLASRRTDMLWVRRTELCCRQR